MFSLQVEGVRTEFANTLLVSLPLAALLQVPWECFLGCLGETNPANLPHPYLYIKERANDPPPFLGNIEALSTYCKSGSVNILDTCLA